MDFGAWYSGATWKDRSALLGRAALWTALVGLPVHGPLVPPPLAVGIFLLLPWIPSFHTNRDRGLLLIPITFYVLHAIGMAYTTDRAFGLFDLEVKLSLMLVPLVAAGLGRSDQDPLRTAMVAFSIGLCIAMIVGWHAAIQCYLANGWRECFTQSYLSVYMHPSYLAWFACWGLFYWGWALINGSVRRGWPRIFVGLFALALMVHVVMLVSKSGLIGLGLVVSILVVQAVRKLPRRVLRWVLLVLVLAITVPAVLLSRVFELRIREAWGAVQLLQHDEDTLITMDSGSSERLVAWLCSTEVLASSPWGVGTGDIKHALMACYEAKGATAAHQRNLNSHCQPLQSGVALGWLGMLLVLAMMVVPFAFGAVRRNPYMATFALLFAVNGSVESVLEVQAGVVFYSLFTVLIIRGQPYRAGPSEPNTLVQHDPLQPTPHR